MSVWATFWGADDLGEPCPPPIAYQGSHVLPSEEDERGGEVGLALVPSHITRDGRDDAPDGGRPWPYVRLSVGQEDVVLDELLARSLYEALGGWLRAQGAAH